jgi:hypothetical protein
VLYPFDRRERDDCLFLHFLPPPFSVVALGRSLALCNLLRSDTPTHISWNVIQAQAMIGKGYFPATTEQTLAVARVSISLMEQYYADRKS